MMFLLFHMPLLCGHGFENIRLSSTKPWVECFNELRSWSNNQDEFALRSLQELKKSFDDPEYIITDANVIDFLSMENKALICSKNKIKSEVKLEIQKALESNR